MMVSFVLSFFPRDVLDEILNLIGSVSEGFPSYSCNRPNCGVCENLNTENEFVFQCGKTFNVKTTMSCEVRNLIYVIRCGGCQEEYIGETGETLRHRLTVHRQQIRDASTRMLYVSGHKANCAKNQSIKFQILPLYKMQNDNTTSRKMKENYFINLFNPKLNRHV